MSAHSLGSAPMSSATARHTCSTFSVCLTCVLANASHIALNSRLLLSSSRLNSSWCRPWMCEYSVRAASAAASSAASSRLSISALCILEKSISSFASRAFFESTSARCVWSVNSVSARSATAFRTAGIMPR